MAETTGKIVLSDDLIISTLVSRSFVVVQEVFMRNDKVKWPHEFQLNNLLKFIRIFVIIPHLQPVQNAKSQFLRKDLSHA